MELPKTHLNLYYRFILKFEIGEKVIYSSEKVDLRCVAIDDQLNFESHISENLVNNLFTTWITALL